MTPADQMLARVQEFSNELCDDENDAGMVRAAVVVWEEVSVDLDGSTTYQTLYAAVGDACTPAMGLGLLEYGKGKLSVDLGLRD